MHYTHLQPLMTVDITEALSKKLVVSAAEAVVILRAQRNVFFTMRIKR